MCSLELCFFISYCGIAVVAIVGAAVVAVEFAVPVFLLAALWWVSTLMYQWVFPREAAFQVLQPTAPELEHYQDCDAATQIKGTIPLNSLLPPKSVKSLKLLSTETGGSSPCPLQLPNMLLVSFI